MVECVCVVLTAATSEKGMGGSGEWGAGEGGSGVLGWFFEGSYRCVSRTMVSDTIRCGLSKYVHPVRSDCIL